MSRSTIEAGRTVELSASATLRALRDAEQCGAAVDVLACDPGGVAPGSPDSPVVATASISHVEGERIDLEDVAWKGEAKADASGSYWLRFRIGDSAFWFTCHWLGPSRRTGEPADRWSVVRTTAVRAQQRRRSRRRQLRRSTRVMLWSSCGTHSCDGAMLNVSADGLACRVQMAEAEALSIGERLQARFQLADERDAYAVDAELRGKGPAGTEDNAILRLEFCHHCSSQVREQLLRALSH